MSCLHDTWNCLFVIAGIFSVCQLSHHISKCCMPSDNVISQDMHLLELMQLQILITLRLVRYLLKPSIFVLKISLLSRRKPEKPLRAQFDVDLQFGYTLLKNTYIQYCTDCSIIHYTELLEQNHDFLRLHPVREKKESCFCSTNCTSQRIGLFALHLNCSAFTYTE